MWCVKRFLVAFAFAVSLIDAQATTSIDKKAYATKGVIELGGRADFSYSSEDRGGNLGRQSQGSLYLAPQLGYFFIPNFEVAVYPTVASVFSTTRSAETAYGALLAPAYILPFWRPFFPYAEALGGSLVSKESISLTWGAGLGLKILILDNALIKIGITYLRNDKRSRIDNNVFQIEDSLTLSTGFGIFF
jgi:hypothetical protein